MPRSPESVWWLVAAQEEVVGSRVVDGCSKGTSGPQPCGRTATSKSGVITLARPGIGRRRTLRLVRAGRSECHQHLESLGWLRRMGQQHGAQL